MQAKEVLKKADVIGSLKALDEAEDIMDKAEDAIVMPQWKVRVFELAGMLFQSIRMQLSVEKYQGIAVRRGAIVYPERSRMGGNLNSNSKLKTQNSKLHPPLIPDNWPLIPDNRPLIPDNRPLIPDPWPLFFSLPFPFLSVIF